MTKVWRSDYVSGDLFSLEMLEVDSLDRDLTLPNLSLDFENYLRSLIFSYSTSGGVNRSFSEFNELRLFTLC